jgi:thiol-disulfide isomerase/thioredoxin
MRRNPIAHEHRRIGLFSLLTLFALTPGFAAAADTEHLDIAAYAGKVLLVDFWASWCVPCRRSFPWLNTMHDKYGEQGLVIIGVNLDESRQDAEAFLAEYSPRFRIWYDANRALAHEFDVMAMPMSYVIGRDGSQVARHFGFKVRKQDEYEAVIVDALSQEE